MRIYRRILVTFTETTPTLPNTAPLAPRSSKAKASAGISLIQQPLLWLRFTPPICVCSAWESLVKGPKKAITGVGRAKAAHAVQSSTRKRKVQSDEEGPAKRTKSSSMGSSHATQYLTSILMVNYSLFVVSPEIHAKR